MYRLIKIRIIRDFEQMEEHWRCQPDVWFSSARPHLHFPPAADFYETAQGLVLRLEVAGIQPESLSRLFSGRPGIGGRGPAPTAAAGGHPALYPPGDGLRRLRALLPPAHPR